MQKKLDPIDIVGQDAAILAAVEVGLGSILHSLKIPLSGQFLSLNQIFLLTRSSLKLRHQRAGRIIGAQISIITALLKSLAPAGKKLTPMLAIGMQGVLFSLGTILFGTNFLGFFVGATLSSLWAFLQPALIYLLIFGSSIIQVGEYFFEKLSEIIHMDSQNWLWFFATLVGLKVVFSWIVVSIALKLPESFVVKYQEKLTQIRISNKSKKENRSPEHSSIIGGAFRDLLHPLFLTSIGLTSVFFIFVESSQSQLIWGILRPLTIGFCFFYLIRWIPKHTNNKILDLWPIRRIAQPLEIAIKKLKQFH